MLMKIKNILKSIACRLGLAKKCCDKNLPAKVEKKNTKGATMSAEKKETKKKEPKKKEVSTQVDAPKVDAPKRKKP